MNIIKLLKFSSDAGKLMLQSGGETYRVEETVSRICQSFDVDEVEVFASPTAVMISISFNGEIHSIVKRINSRGIDLNMVHNINSLSREIYQHRPSIDVCEEKLKDICRSNSYSLIKNLFFAGVSTSTFTILFNGGIREFLCAFFIGVFTKLVSTNLEKSNLNDFFINIICGGLVAISSIVCLHFGIIKDLDKLIAGSIMLLVPGLALTNSIRDLLEGQLVSGLTRAAEAFFVGLSAAIGTGSILHIYLRLGGF